MKLRVGIVGCGAIATDLHLPAAARSERCEISAIVDTDLARARAVARQFAVPLAVSSLADLKGQVDAILLATPPHIRIDPIQEAFASGWHVLCEKPLANSVAECELLEQLAERSGSVAGVAHIYRFWPAREYLRRALEAGEFGRPIRAYLSQGNVYSWKSVSGYTVRKELVPGGLLINAGIHPLDTLLWWFGEAIGVEYIDDALGGLESNCHVKLQFRSGVSAELLMSRTTRLKHLMQIETDRGLIDLPTYSRGEFQVHEAGGSRSIQVPDASDDPLLPAVRQLDDFAEAIAAGSTPRVTFSEGKRVIELVERCYLMKRERPLPLRAPVPGAMW